MAGAAIARLGDPTMHPGGRLMAPSAPPPGYGTVWIEGKLPAFIGGIHTCPVHVRQYPPPINVVQPDPRSLASRVFINGRPVACENGETVCQAKIAPRPTATVRIGGG